MGGGDRNPAESRGPGQWAPWEPAWVQVRRGTPAEAGPLRRQKTQSNGISPGFSLKCRPQERECAPGCPRIAWAHLKRRARIPFLGPARRPGNSVGKSPPSPERARARGPLATGWTCPHRVRPLRGVVNCGNPVTRGVCPGLMDFRSEGPHRQHLVGVEPGRPSIKRVARESGSVPKIVGRNVGMGKGPRVLLDRCRAHSGSANASVSSTGFRASSAPREWHFGEDPELSLQNGNPRSRLRILGPVRSKEAESSYRCAGRIRPFDRRRGALPKVSSQASFRVSTILRT